MMKSFMKYFKTAVKCSLACGVLCCIVYPAALTAVGQIAFNKQANGNLVEVTMNEGPMAGQKVAVGSELVGQLFEDPKYFHGRVSSVNYNVYTEEEKEDGTYGGVSSGSFNYGNSNPDLKARVEEDFAAWQEAHPTIDPDEVPTDLLTASGSGLDPHITPEGAAVQVDAVSEASGLAKETIEQIVADNTEHKVLGIFGEERVNVLGCNLDIAEELGVITR